MASADRKEKKNQEEKKNSRSLVSLMTDAMETAVSSGAASQVRPRPRLARFFCGCRFETCAAQFFHSRQQFLPPNFWLGWAGSRVTLARTVEATGSGQVQLCDDDDVRCACVVVLRRQ